VRLAAFLAFVTLAGYFGLYAILRVNGEIELEGFIDPFNGHLRQHFYVPFAWMNPPNKLQIAVYDDSPRARPEARGIQEWPRWSDEHLAEEPPKWWLLRSMVPTVMWPAVNLEAALDRRGWLPWTNIDRNP